MIEIQVNNLVKSFEVGKNVLDGLTFQVDQGERVGLLGRNGAGKTTLFKILTGELDYDEGTVVATAMVGFSGEGDYDLIDRGSWLTATRSDDACYGVVHRVAVSASCKGRGAASLLLACAEELTRDRGCESVRIDTHPGNLPMRRLLEKSGYAECGVIYIAHAEAGTPERIAYEKLV